MTDFYKKIDTQILKKSPFHWILGWHLFLPIIVVLALFGAVIGYLIPTETYTYSAGELGIASFFLGFMAFMAFILYVVRQVRFNSFRIDHRVPFKKSILIFFSFWLIVTLLSLIPFTPYQIHSWHVQKKIKSITSDFDKDTETLYKGGSFFEGRISVKERELLIKTTKDIVISDKDRMYINRNVDIFFKGDEVLINKVEYSFGHNRYYGNDDKRLFPKTISKEEALVYITNFIKVADKYNITLTERNAQEIYNKRKLFNISDFGYSYSLFVLNDTIKDRSAVHAYSRMMSNYRYNLKNNKDFTVVLGLLIFSILVALLLWIFISVPKADFGYSILASVLIMLLMGVLTAIFTFSSAGGGFVLKVLLYLAILTVYIIGFSGNETTRLKHVFKIVSHYAAVLFALLIFIEIEDQNLVPNKYEFLLFVLILITSVIISVFLFKKVYENNRLLPK